MKIDSIVSWLIQSDWLFLLLWVAILAGAFAFTLIEDRVPLMARLQKTRSQTLRS